jgi:hypothetical protein
MVLALIWNPRGINRPDKVTRVHDLIKETCPDIISFSESKKEDFYVIQLKQLDPNDKFQWNWLPANGTAGGILVGISHDMFEVIRWDILVFTIFVILKDRKTRMIWRFISVYGSAYDEHKLASINELHNVFASWNRPNLVGGDFNLIRESCTLAI